MPPQIQALREGFKHLSNKLDVLIARKNDINIDVGQELSDTMKETISQPLLTAFEDIVKRLGEIEKKQIPDYSAELKELARKLDAIKNLKIGLSEEGISLSNHFKNLQRAVENKNNNDITKALTDVKKAVQSIKLNVPKTDLTPVVTELKNVSKKIDNIPQPIIPDPAKEMAPLLRNMDKKLDTIAGKETKFPKELRLPKHQLDQIVGSIGGGIGANPGAATRVTIANVSMSSADTEYSYTFPNNTTSWAIKVRSQNTKLLYAFESGKLPTSGDGSAYITAPQNFIKSQGDVEWGGKTIYLQTGSASQTAEIESHQL